MTESRQFLGEFGGEYPSLPGVPWIRYERAIPMMQKLAGVCEAEIPEEYRDNHHFWYVVARTYWDQRKKIPAEMHLSAPRSDTLRGVRRLALKNALERSAERVSLESLTAVDPLTGASNRRALDAYLKNILQHGRRGTVDVLVFFDVDKFKSFNDQYGHTVGDIVLQQLAAMIKEELRGIDMLGRYGGEEFAIILPEVDASGERWKDRYLQRVEDLRQSVESRLALLVAQTADVSMGEKAISASFGVAEIDDSVREAWRLKKDLKVVYDPADRQLYLAKANGRNVVMFGGKPVPKKSHV